MNLYEITKTIKRVSKNHTERCTIRGEDVERRLLWDNLVLRLILFLGAGASKAVGLPTLPELTQEIRKTFDDPFGQIDKLLRQPSGIDYPENELDLEIYMTIIDSLAEPKLSILELGPFAVYLYNLVENKGGISRLLNSQDIRTLKKNSIELMNRTLRTGIDAEIAKETLRWPIWHLQS